MLVYTDVFYCDLTAMCRSVSRDRDSRVPIGRIRPSSLRSTSRGSVPVPFFLFFGFGTPLCSPSSRGDRIVRRESSRAIGSYPSSGRLCENFEACLPLMQSERPSKCEVRENRLTWGLSCFWGCSLKGVIHQQHLRDATRARDPADR